MGSWTIAERSSRLTIAEPETRTPNKSASLDRDLEDAVREYVRTYVLWRGRRRAAEAFGVSRHTLWRFLRRGHAGRALPHAVLDTVGDSVEALEAATWAVAATERLMASRPAPKPVRAPHPLSQAMEDTLLLLCAAPLATVDELSRFGRIPASTLRDRLKKLVKMDMADSVSHSLGVLGPHPHLRHFPTEKGIDAGAMVEWGPKTFLREYPVSKQWFRLLADPAGRRGCALPRRRSGRRRRLPGTAGESGPLPPGSLRHAGYPVRRPLRGAAAPRADAALGQPALPAENPGEPVARPTPHGDAGAGPLRPGQPAGRPHPGGRHAPPGDLRRHRGGAPGRRPQGRGMAAVRERHGTRPPGGGGSRRVPERHHSLDRPGGGAFSRIQAGNATRGQRESRDPPGDHLPRTSAGRHAGAVGTAQVLPRRPAHPC